MTLFDTDVLIDAGRGVSDAAVSLARYTAKGVSVVTLMELTVGCRDRRELNDLERFIRRFTIVPLTPASSTRAANLLAQYRLSHGLLMPDALIAATALEAGLPLVTKNQRDFRFTLGLNLLPYPPAAQALDS